MYSGWRQMNRRLNRQKIQRLPPHARHVYQFATFFGRTHESNDLARMVKIGYNLGGAYATNLLQFFV